MQLFLIDLEQHAEDIHHRAAIARPARQVVVTIHHARFDPCWFAVNFFDALGDQRTWHPHRHRHGGTGQGSGGNHPRHLVHVITGRVDQHQLLHLLRLRQGEVPGDITAQRVADNRCLVYAEVVEQQAEYLDHPLSGIHTIAGRAGEAETRHIEANHPVIRGKGWQPVIPGVQRGDNTVDQDQHWLIATALIAVVQIETVEFDVTRAIGGIAIARFEALQRQGAEAQTGKTGRQRWRQRETGSRHAGTSKLLLWERRIRSIRARPLKPDA